MVVSITKENINNYSDEFINKSFFINKLNNNPFAKVLFLFENNSIIGYLYYSDIYDRVEINQIEIKKKYRKQGKGNYLLNKLLKAEKKDVTLEVKETNYPAIKLYEKNGFLKKAIRKNYYGEINGILYEKKYIPQKTSNELGD